MTGTRSTESARADAALDTARDAYGMAIGSDHLTTILVADTVAVLMSEIAQAEDTVQATADVLEVAVLRVIRGELEG